MFPWVHLGTRCWQVEPVSNQKDMEPMIWKKEMWESLQMSWFHCRYSMAWRIVNAIIFSVQKKKYSFKHDYIMSLCTTSQALCVVINRVRYKQDVNASFNSIAFNINFIFQHNNLSHTVCFGRLTLRWNVKQNVWNRTVMDSHSNNKHQILGCATLTMTGNVTLQPLEGAEYYIKH